MKMHQKLNGLDVLAMCKQQGGEAVVLLHWLKQEKYEEYVVCTTFDGKSWTFGEYFHEANYDSKAEAYAAAYLTFCKRSGLNAVISRGAKSKRTLIFAKLFNELRIVPDRREAHMRS